MNQRETAIYDEASKEKEQKLRGEISLGVQAMKLTASRIRD
jgi:hypothetical protein